MLETISEQQLAISDRLHKLIETFKSEPEPVEPTLRLMLSPLDEGMSEMKQMLSPNSGPADSSDSPSES
ncbi:hypothetical protein BRCH_04453c [Candidatus Burkholderia brachyanthoides]|nr:hypothetical protein BRCH_04453c [Candidatus Burkholderia brachyanthoides]